MRRVIIGAAIGAVVTWVSFTFWDGYQVTRVLSLPIENWIDISAAEAVGVPPEDEPAIHIAFTLMRPITMRVSISNKDQQTGNEHCSGGTGTLTFDVGVLIEDNYNIRSIAGIEQCDWPPGIYTSRLTWILTDIMTGVQRTHILDLNSFEVAASEVEQSMPP